MKSNLGLDKIGGWFHEKIVSRFPKQFSFVRNLFAVLGVFTTVYILFFFLVQKPKMIAESEAKVKSLEKEIKNGEKVISKLEKENKKIYGEINGLNKDLEQLKNKSEKYRKQYEKQVNNINNLSDKQLSRVFADEF